MPLKLRSLVNKIVSKLGISIVHVELVGADIAEAIRDALQIYSKYLPGSNWVDISVSSAVSRYVISHRNLINVVDVQFVRDYRIFGGGYDIIPDFTERIGEIEQWFQRRRDFERVLSTEPMWEVVWEIPETAPGDPAPTKRELALYIKVAESVEYKCSYLYTWYYEASDDYMYGLPAIPENHTHWVEDYAFAVCKTVLGRILDKFKGLPSPAMTGLDGADLRAEGREEMMALERSILSWQRQVPPIVG